MEREEFRKYIERARGEREAFVAEVERAVRAEGGYAAPMRRGSGWVTITPSTRPGIRWQVTFWDGDPLHGAPQPTGHIDVTGDLAEAAREIRGLVPSVAVKNTSLSSDVPELTVLMPGASAPGGLGEYVNERRPRFERALGWPFGKRLGCGHFGCVFKSSGPWVVKVTSDPEEGNVWAFVKELYDDRRLSRSMSGVCRVDDVVRVRPDVGVRGDYGAVNLAPVHAIRREEAEPLFYEDAGIFRISETTSRLLADRTDVSIGFLPTSRMKDFIGLQTFVAALKHLDDYDALTLDAFSDLRQGNRIEPSTRERMLTAARLVASEPLLHDLGVTLETTLTEADFFFADVHKGNLGWRVHRSIQGDKRPLTAVILDAGTARTPYAPEIRETEIAANRGHAVSRLSERRR